MKVSGAVLSNGANAIKVDIGFTPDYVELYSILSGAEIGCKWFRVLVDKGVTAAQGLYGIAIANAGDISVAAAATNGIIAYDESDHLYALLPDPVTGNLIKVRMGVKTAVTGVYNVDYNPLTNYNTYAVDRSATVNGTLIRPTVHNGYIYEMKTKTAGAAGTEPTWETTPGEETTDTIGNIWICREENLVKGGGMGFEIGATLAGTADLYIVFKAERHDRMGYMGDAATKSPVTFD